MSIERKRDEILKEKAIRIQKLEQLKNLNIEPYPYKFRRTHLAQEIHKLAENGEFPDSVATAGRIIARREHGKTTFFHLSDASGKIQLYFRQDTLGEKFRLLKLLDIGDFLGVSGKVFKTKTGETTILVNDWTLLSKALHPLPEKWHGLSDIETRYRQRYLDLIANPLGKEVFIKRAKIINLIRQFLDNRGYIEVETPVLQPIYGGAAARPFKTNYNVLNSEMYLRISDELYLKRLIIGGIEKVYEIGKDFRNEGLDRFHNPEFTAIEIYEAYSDYYDMMDLTEELFRFLAQKLFNKTEITFNEKMIDFGKPFKRIRFIDALKEELAVNPLTLSEDDFNKLCERYRIEGREKLSKGRLLDKLFSLSVQKELIEPTFVLDYPQITTPLAKAHRTDKDLCERFELIIDGIELANAFSELNDPIGQKERFLEQIKGNEEFCVLDEDFITALEYGMPPCGGLGLGIDRIVMLFTDKDSIRDVILFPQLRSDEKR